MNKLQFNRMATTVLFAVLVFVSSVALAQKPIKRPPKKVRQTTTQQVAKPPKKTVAPAKTSKPTTPVKSVEVEESVAQAKPTKGEINGHEWVDLGLSVKWATTNIGADSPSDFGDYFAFGETIPKSDSYVYTIEDLKKTKTLKIPDISGNIKYDAARYNWGGSWRMPTKEELKELRYKCEWKISYQGYEVVGPNGNKIYLPGSGCKGYGASGLFGDYALYRSSTIEQKHYCNYVIYFSRSKKNVNLTTQGQSSGYSIRPVTE